MKIFRAMKQILQRNSVPEKDRIPVLEKAAYGAGNAVEQLTVWQPQQLLTPVFNIGLGMNPASLGLIMAIWRAWDAITDPVMGNISDNTRTRWGRRRPYIVVGAILTGLVFPLIWWVPESMGQTGMFLWLLLGGILLYTCFTVWSMPYYSLQLEMTADYNERTSVSAYRAFARSLTTIAGGWLLALAALPFFSRSGDGSPDLFNGMRWVSLLIAAAIIVTGVIPGIFVKERFYESDARQQKKLKLLTSLRQTLKTKPFMLLCLIAVFKIFGFGLVGSLGFYLNAYYVNGGDVGAAAKVQGVINTVVFSTTFLAIPFCSWFSSRFGKQALLYLVCGLSAAGALSTYIFLRPGHPWLQIFPAFLWGPIGTGLWMIVPSMQADVADYDELHNHVRREGSFSAVFSWATKVAWTLNTALSGAILVWTGFDVALKGGQSAATFLAMRHCYAIIPVIFLVVSVIAIKRYPLNRAKVNEIRKQLDARLELRENISQ